LRFVRRVFDKIHIFRLEWMIRIWWTVIVHRGFIRNDQPLFSRTNAEKI
jgi:hypothetical protein